MISETYSKRLQELAGILSEDNSGKLKSFGISDQVASFIVKLDDKLAMFIANITLAEFVKREHIEGHNIKEIIPILNQNDYLGFLEENEGRVNYVLEWIKSPNRPEVDIKTIQDLSQAEEMARAWHNNRTATGSIKDEAGDVIDVYPKEGLYWIDLKTNHSTAEAEAMGHCGTDNGATTLFSLRDKNKSPHVTIAYNGDAKTLKQVKGRNNQRPLPEYMKYVYDFLEKLVAKGVLVNVEWSYGKDLDDEEINFVFEGHKDVLIASILEKNLKQIKYVLPPFTKEEIIEVVGKEKYKEYITKLLNKSLELPYFNPKLKKGDIIDAVGLDGFNQYIKELFEKTIDDQRYQIGLPKNEIIKVVGEEQYNIYIHNLLDRVLQHPFNNKANMTKDELFALLGDAGYKNFINNLITKIVNGVNSESSLKYALNQHGIAYDEAKVRAIVGAKVWFMFVKRVTMRGQSNIGNGIW